MHDNLDDAAKKEGVAEFNLVKGLIVATISGILSACFNFGIEAGKDMAHLAVERGANPLFQNNVIFVVLLWGGLTTNFLWCMILNARNKSFSDYRNTQSPLLNNYGWAALAGVMTSVGASVMAASAVVIATSLKIFMGFLLRWSSESLEGFIPAHRTEKRRWLGVPVLLATNPQTRLRNAAVSAQPSTGSHRRSGGHDCRDVAHAGGRQLQAAQKRRCRILSDGFDRDASLHGRRHSAPARTGRLSAARTARYQTWNEEDVSHSLKIILGVPQTRIREPRG